MEVTSVSVSFTSLQMDRESISKVLGKVTISEKMEVTLVSVSVYFTPLEMACESISKVFKENIATLESFTCTFL